MPYNLDDMLVIGLSSMALFDLAEADQVFRTEGLAAYRAHQRENEKVELRPGTAFPLVRGLLRINELGEGRLVEVIIISRNDADTSMRVFNSVDHYGLDITRAAFTDGRDAVQYLEPFRCNLFLSADAGHVQDALKRKFPAALVLRPPENVGEAETAEEVRIAFDGDAVLFDAESERVFQSEGLEAFLKREAGLADQPMDPGPFEPFLMALKRIQSNFSEDGSPVRTALVTSRNAPAHSRVINTLRAWGVRTDETFFLGGIDKSGILNVLRPHIFFDDQMIHLEAASKLVPSAQVPVVAEQMELTLPVENAGGQVVELPQKTTPAEKEKDEGPGSITNGAPENLDHSDAG